MNKRIQILDCTLRDGGFCLEDAQKNGISEEKFSSKDIKKIISYLRDSKLDIIELGAVEITSDDKRGFAIYQNLESISETIPANRNKNQMYAAFYRGPDTPIEDIPDWNPSLCDMIRVIIRYSEQKKSLDFCKALAQKGYKVFIQPMLTMRYTSDEIQNLIYAANEMNAYALYFVDSYGYMMEQDILNFFHCFDKGLKPSIKIGFHAHNNMNLAFANVLTFLNINTPREIIIDACAMGMGQGAGNLQTELIINYFNTNYGTSYDYNSVLEVCETINIYYQKNLWGYSVTRLLPALHKTAYKYAIYFCNKYQLTFAEINALLTNMPADFRHRFTPENAEKLLHYSNIL